MFLSCYLLFITLELLWQSLITLTIKEIQYLLIFLCCHKYNKWLGWVRFFLAIIITIMEGLGLFFYCCHKYSRWLDLFAFCPRWIDEKEQVFDKKWNFNVLELACFTSSPTKGWQELCNKFIWNCCQSFNVKGNFFLKNLEVNGTWAIHV